MMTVTIPQLGIFAIIALLAVMFDLKPNFIRIPALIIFFIMYYRSLDVHISKALAVWVYTCSALMVIFNFANTVDAIIHPELGADIYNMADSCLQLAMSVFFYSLFWYPVKKYGTILIESISVNQVWYPGMTIPIIIMGFNIGVRMRIYNTLYVNRVFSAYWWLLSVCLVLDILIAVFFYFIAMGITRQARISEENKILQMQERYYKAQQKYMDETARVRHDFKHTIHTLEKLTEGGDIESIRSYLSRYTKSMPKNETAYYCENMAVNALLNYYRQQADDNDIKFSIEVDFPQELPVTDVEMCAVIGNILENATIACTEIPKEERFIDIAIRTENNAQIYIVAANSFNGKVDEDDGKFRTTHGGSGIGLSSVNAVAAGCGGFARFSHKDKEFFSDVILPLKRG